MEVTITIQNKEVKHRRKIWIPDGDNAFVLFNFNGFINEFKRLLKKK